MSTDLVDRLSRHCKDRKRARKIVVYSRRHETDALNLGTDLETAIDDSSIRVAPFKENQSIAALLRRGHVVTVAPWNWDDIAREDRAHPRCLLLQYCFDPVDLESINEGLGWRDRKVVGRQVV